jgi:hypothetical protein
MSNKAIRKTSDRPAFRFIKVISVLVSDKL